MDHHPTPSIMQDANRAAMPAQMYGYQAQHNMNAGVNAWMANPNMPGNDNTVGDDNNIGNADNIGNDSTIGNVNTTGYTSHMSVGGYQPPAYAMDDMNEDPSGWSAYADASYAGDYPLLATDMFGYPSYAAPNGQTFNEAQGLQSFHPADMQQSIPAAAQGSPSLNLASTQYWDPVVAQGLPIPNPQHMIAAPPLPPPPSNDDYTSYTWAGGDVPVDFEPDQWGSEVPNNMAMLNMEPQLGNFWESKGSMTMSPASDSADTMSIPHAIAQRLNPVAVVPARARSAPLNTSGPFIGVSPSGKQTRRRVGRPRNSPLAPSSRTALAIDARTRARSVARTKKAVTANKRAT